MAEGYKHQEFPKMVYHESGKHAIVKNAEEMESLGDGWSHKPADSHLDEFQTGNAIKAVSIEDASTAKFARPVKAKKAN